MAMSYGYFSQAWCSLAPQRMTAVEIRQSGLSFANCSKEPGGGGEWFASAPESLCGSKLPRVPVCDRNILILLD
jgi:hypothetical protein